MAEKKIKKVAIIGGGCASITAALELTKPERNGEFDVTIYQTGWRLGGKGASGRDETTGRIEEHGLHLWMGFYENAFRMMRDCYEELDRPVGQPMRDWREAFKPDNFVGVTEHIDADQWRNWAAYFPPAAGLPGDPLKNRNPFSVHGYLTRCVLLLQTLVVSVQNKGNDPVDENAGNNLASAVSFLIKNLVISARGDQVNLVKKLSKFGTLAVGTVVLEAIKILQSAIDRITSNVESNRIGSLVEQIYNVIRQQFSGWINKDEELRRVWEIIDVVLAIIRGVLGDGLLFSPKGFEAIDHHDWRDWLRSHGASEQTLDSAFIRGSYDLLFAYEDGDIEKPRLAAGQALRGAMRMFFTYRGALFWKMQAGMGDIVFAPAYEVLKKRGVNFEFFHQLNNVGLSSDKTHVTTLDMRIQAQMIKKRDYNPLVTIKNLPCWPSKPLYNQITNGSTLKKSSWNPESPSEQRCVERKKLKIGKDFDYVVLGIGLGAVPNVCGELIEAEPAWQNMVQNVKTVATQAFQVWLNKPVEELGWNLPPINISGFVEPFDTWADMRQLIKWEDWKVDPSAIAYFCSVLPDVQVKKVNPEIPADKFVYDSAIQFLNKDVRHFWPLAVSDKEFGWELLHSQTVKSKLAKGAHPFGTQFWTANINPTDRYVLSLPGSLVHRISPLDNRFDNLTIAGDWTACGHQAGCVEAAVMSGMLAASALSTYPRPGDIIGYDHP